MSAIYYYSIADFSFFFKSYLQRNQIFFRDGGRCCNKRENLDDKRAGKRYFERFCWMLLNMKCSLTENRNYVILFLKNRQEGTKLSPEEEKVQRLEQRIAQLEQALQEKNAPASSQPPVPSTILQQETPPTIPPPAPEIPPMQTTQPTPPPPSFQQNASWTSQAQTMQSVPPPQRMDTEQKFGKIVMGILASIFIFAAILIGYAFLPSILQMVGLFVIGAGVSAAGLYGISKRKYPYFFLSVAGCGAGILYLSILLSYWYFSVVGKWAMYGMLLLWAVFVLWMSRKSVPLFRLIGQCGIVLSLLFAFRQLNVLETGMIFFFFVLVSALYQFADRRIGIACQLSTLLCNAISLLILTVLFTVTLRRVLHTPMFGLLLAEGMLLILYTLAQLIWYRMRMRPAERSGMGYFFTALSGLLLVQLQAQWFFFFWDTGKYLLSALTAVAIWMLYDRKQEESALRNLMACICSILAFLWLLPLSVLPALLGWVLLEAALFVMWHVRKQNGCLYLGYVLFLFGIRLILSKISVLDDITLQYGAWVAIDIAVTLYLRHCRSHRGMEILSLCVTGWLMVEGWCLLLLEGLFRSVAAFWHAIGSLFRQTGNDVVTVIPWDTILLAAFVVLIFLLNVPYLLRKYPNRNGVGVYLGIRMTLLGAVVSGAFFQRAAWSSGLLTLLSFGMLLVGFHFHQKGLRIYSLIAMMVFLCKLLLLDLSYQTPLLWAGAFLICGLLCFGISFAYNRIGQKHIESAEPMKQKGEK